MKKNIVIVVLLVMCVTFGFLAFSNEKETILEEDDVPRATHKEMLSMMLETDSGSGEYSLETRNSWPTKEDGYIFNSTLSKCERGSQLRWDEENNMVVMVGTTSDKCYVYFDVYVEPKVLLADWVKSQYTGTQGENNLYYHDSTLENGAGDNSYRYAGSSETTNNFVCFGSDNEICPNDNLYRIIGVFGNQVKLIKYDYANSNLLGINGDYYNTYSGAGWETSYYQGSGNLLTIGVYYWNKANYSETYNATGYSNVWSYSELNNTHLNKNYVSYLDNIDTKWADKIAVTNWIVGGNTYTNIETSTAKIAYTNEIITPSTNVQTMYSEKIGLMYVSDYYFGALLTYWTYPGFSPNGASYDYRSAIAYNWMYMGLYEWTMVRQSDGAGYVFGISNSGCLTYLSTVSDDYWTYAIRPVFYLNSDVTYVSGSGTKEDSIRIN